MIEAQIIIISLAVFGLVFLVFMLKKKDILVELFIAALISAVWVLINRLYIYDDINYIILGLSIFPWICWTAGLVLAKEFYEWMNFKGKFFVMLIVYWIGVIVLEYVGYNYFGIQLASEYVGLFGYNLMHMPYWGQIYYLSIAPVYVLIMNFLEVE